MPEHLPGKSDPNLARKAILVVEDNATLTQFYQQALEDDYNVIIAKSGEDALNRLKVLGAVDLMVLDLRLPGGMSGIAVLNEMKRSFSAVPVMIVTACTGGKIKTQLSELGPYEYIEKPFNVGYLLNRIKARTEAH